MVLIMINQSNQHFPWNIQKHSHNIFRLKLDNFIILSLLQVIKNKQHEEEIWENILMVAV